jgi:hypothetical protein
MSKGKWSRRPDRQNPFCHAEPLSPRKRLGADRRISIQARGVRKPHHEAGHTTAPDHKPGSSDESACIPGGVHTRGLTATLLG